MTKNFRLVAAAAALAAGVFAAPLQAADTSQFQPITGELKPFVLRSVDTRPVKVAVILRGDPVAIVQRNAGRELTAGERAAIIGAPLVFLGVGLPDDQIHAPNEKVTLSMLYRGAEAAALLWTELAAVGRAGLSV